MKILKIEKFNNKKFTIGAHQDIKGVRTKNSNLDKGQKGLSNLKNSKNLRQFLRKVLYTSKHGNIHNGQIKEKREGEVEKNI